MKEQEIKEILVDTQLQLINIIPLRQEYHLLTINPNIIQLPEGE